MAFIILGLSHKTTPIELREKLAILEKDVPGILAGLIQSPEIQEAMLVSTCNRVEACIVAQHPARALEVVKQMYCERGDLSLAALEPHLYLREGELAVGHLFKVTAGLDSLVLGEPQIAGQVKDSYSRAVDANTTGPYLNKLLHRTFNVSKKIRTETGIGRHPVSISYAAVLLAERIFGNLGEKRVLLIGTGEMGRLAAKHLAERQVGEIWIANRTRAKAEEVLKELDATVIPFEEVHERLHEADIIITSTGAEDYVIQTSHVDTAMKKRKNDPMFFIDISVPRNIEPTINQIQNVYLYDVDHLQGIVDTNQKEREQEARRAEGMIAEEVKSFLDYVSQMGVSPTIRQLSQKFDMIRRKEVENYLGRRPNLSQEDRDEVEACTKAIVNKILHEPIITMKTDAKEDGGHKTSEFLRKIFKLESET
jgi:glutamyl-tRNA reductase